MLPSSSADGDRVEEMRAVVPQRPIAVAEVPLSQLATVGEKAHKVKATDVVIETGPEDDAAPVSVEPNTQADERTPLTTRPHRTMGQVYRIMKNTIYSDDDCPEGNIVLETANCGGRFVHYVNGLFQYLVRNPKTMGLILTTVIILLFFKYSQQVVVKSVNVAVNVHPGLEPSNELRAAVLSFTQELRSFANLAKTMNWSYHSDGSAVYDVNSIIGSTFFSVAATFQESFAGNLNTYVIQRLPQQLLQVTGQQHFRDAQLNQGALSNHWGMAGCESVNESLGVPLTTLCRITLPDGTVLGFNAKNRTDILYTATNGYMEDRNDLIHTLAYTTKDSWESTEGVWSPPRQFADTFFNQTKRVISYMIPIAFDQVTGLCTAIAGIDVSLARLAATVNVSTPNIEVVVADCEGGGSPQGQFVLDTFDPDLFWSTSYPADSTPSARINSVAAPIRAHHKGGFLVNASFYENGLRYQSLTMLDRWALLAKSPLVLSAAEVVAALRAAFDEYEHISASTADLFDDSCTSAADAGRDCPFLELVGQLEGAFGARVHALYVAYAMETPSSSSSSSGSSSGDESSRGSSRGSDSHHSSSVGSSSGSGSDSHRSSSNVGVGSGSNSSSGSSSNSHYSSSSSGSNSGSHSSKSSSSRSDSTDSSRRSSVNSGSGSGSGSSSSSPHRDSSSESSHTTGVRSSASGSVSHPSASMSSSTVPSASTEATSASSASSDSNTPSSSTPDGSFVRSERRSAALAADPVPWGVCGCTYSGNDENLQLCFYTASDLTETVFDGSLRSKANSTQTLSFPTTRRYAFVQNEIINAAEPPVVGRGYWTRPYYSEDTVTQKNLSAISFVLPFRVNAAGEVIAAVVFDLSLDWLPVFLDANTHSGTTGLFLLDRRDNGSFIASRSYTPDGVYPAMSTPNTTINRVMKALFEQANSFARAISFHDGTHLINYQLVEPAWGIVEIIPAAVALERFLPTRTVTGATDALRLIPTGQTIGLFLYVGGILLAYCLNLLILGCSQLGQRE